MTTVGEALHRRRIAALFALPFGKSKAYIMIGVNPGGRTQGGEGMIHFEPDDPPLTLGALNLDNDFQSFTPDLVKRIGRGPPTSR
jgi:hypothetical protein